MSRTRIRGSDETTVTRFRGAHLHAEEVRNDGLDADLSAGNGYKHKYQLKTVAAGDGEPGAIDAAHKVLRRGGNAARPVAW